MELPLYLTNDSLNNDNDNQRQMNHSIVIDLVR